MDTSALDALLARFESGLKWVRHEPARPARWSAWPAGVHPAVVSAAQAVGLDRLWCHQAEAMALLLAGEHTVLASGTATGKSLGYVAPALSALLDDPAARVLYLAPTKALAQDQHAMLRRWNDALPRSARVAVGTYDGDTPRARRAAIRGQVRWLLTNPEMLHQGILPNHTRWAAFLGGLKLLVLDELHVYRGVFGSHVANLLRRLARLVRFHGGGALQLVACSATIANPGDLARRLLGDGAAVRVVWGADAPRPPRSFACVVPPVVDPALGIRRRLSDEVEGVTRVLLQSGLSTIVFVRTRRFAEALVRALRRAATALQGLQPRAAIRAYRAGLRPAERRSIEQGLRQGTVRVVVSTSALELGVDIGPLQVAVLAGYPGDLASLRQQAGRVGRRGDGALVVLVAGSGALDRYVMQRPELLLGGSPEHAQVDPDNPLILRDHLRCAAYELPFEPGEGLGEAQGAHAGSCAAQLLAQADAGELRHARERFYWVGDDAPAPRVGLRSLEVRPIRLELARQPGARRRRTGLVGTLERSGALGVAHPGALYVHDGDVYRVIDLDWEEGRAALRVEESENVTIAEQEHELRLLEALGEREVPGALLRYGPTERVVRTTGFRELDARTGTVVAEEALELPELRSQAVAFWLTLSEVAVGRLRAGGWWRPDPVGYRGPDWQAQRRRARARDQRLCVHCGAPEAGRQHDIHHLRPFRDFGYRRGENQAHREANRLENLVTLCQVCHARAENGQRFQGALERLAYLLSNVAPLVLMCDPPDLDVRVWRQPPTEGVTAESAGETPSVVIAERAPAGVGYAEALFALYTEVLGHAQELARRCGCVGGCPACVGPPDDRGTDGRDFALAILRELRPDTPEVAP